MARSARGGDVLSGYNAGDCVSNRCIDWIGADTACSRVCYSMLNEPCDMRSPSTWVAPGDHSHVAGAGRNVQCLGPEPGIELSCWENSCTDRPPHGATCHSDASCQLGDPDSMCEQGFCTKASAIPGGAICRSHGQCASGHCWEWFDDDWCLSTEGEPCNIAIGNIETNTNDYYTVRDRGDSDGIGGLDLHSRHHHAVRDGSWYGEDHKIRCVDWNAFDGHSHTYYCEANQCRGNRGYNQNCDHSSQCNSGDCYNGKCMATCQSGVFSQAAFDNDDRPNQCAQDGEAQRRRQPVRRQQWHVDVLHPERHRRGAGRVPPPGTRCDWCEQSTDCDGTNQRGFGSMRQRVERVHARRLADARPAQKLPGGAECRDNEDCRSNQCASWAGDSTARATSCAASAARAV